MYINEHVASTERVFPDQGRLGLHRYDMNENPEGLPAEFVERVLSEVTPEYLATYPEPDAFTEKYAAFVGVGPDNVMATNGSDQAIRYLLETFCAPGHEVVTVAPSFEMYWVNCNILGLKHVPVPYADDLTVDVDDIVAAIGPDTDVVVLLNPNNPVGNVYTPEEAERVVKAAQEHDALVIIDEAYHYFYDKTFLDLATSEPNVVVLRTFSKLFSIAALRLGVAISNPTVIDALRKIRLTFDVNSLALTFGERIVEEPGMVDRLVAIEREGRDYTLERLAAEGYEVRDCRGNFIFVRPRRNAAEVGERLRDEHDVLVKWWNGGMLAPYLRVSTGSRTAMDAFIDAFLEVDGR